MSASENVKLATDRLHEALLARVPCEPVRDLVGRDDVDAAYAVQRMLTARRVDAGARVVGHKIGLTSPAVQAQLGVDRPDFGVLFDTMAYAGGDDVPAAAVLQPRVEAEVAFVLGQDLGDGPLDAGQVRRATDYVVAAVEVCGSRIRDWDISFADTVADNASAGAFVLGPRRVSLNDLDTASITMSMSIDHEVVSEGVGAACLGDPVNAVVWLARTLRDLGTPLRAGHVVLSGALGPMHAVRSGQRVTARFSDIGAVSFTVS